MDVRVVSMGVGDGLMHMPMTMGQPRIVREVVMVLMVLVVVVEMAMLERFVGMFMLVALGQV